MKIYIAATISIENLRKQQGAGIPQPMFDRLIALDPTTDVENGKGGKYCPWILNHFKKGDITEDDFQNLEDALLMFAEKYKKFQHSDIGQYKTFAELLEDSHRVGNMQMTDKEKKKALKKKAHQANTEDKEFICEDGVWEVWKPLTYEGSISLARTGGVKARWCTAYEGNDSYWRSYTSKGPLYIFINTENPHEKYQLHIPTKSWYDINDDSQGMDRFYQFCGEHPVIGDVFEIKNEGGVLSQAGEIVNYADNATEIHIPDYITKLPNFKFPASCKYVSIPDGIDTINADAFRGTKVETCEFSGVTKIGASAFRDSAIRNINLKSVDKFGSSSFRNCKNLTNVQFFDGPITLGSYAFAETPITGELAITPDFKITMGTFDDCPNLTIVWEKPDEPYEFSNIKELVLDEATCPQLLETNKGYVRIRTTGGQVYEV